MVSLYVGSSESYAGKTVVCMALGMHLREQGKRIGYMKPLAVLPTRAGKVTADEWGLVTIEKVVIKKEEKITLTILR